MKLLDILDELCGLIQRTRWPDGGTCPDVTHQASATQDTATETASQQQTMQCSSVSPLELQQAAGSAVLWCLAAATTGNSCFADTAAVAQRLLDLQPVFSKLYAVEDMDMIDGVISGWELVASILAGAAQFEPGIAEQLEASTSSLECLAAAPAVTTSSGSTVEGPRSTNPAPQQQSHQLQRLLQWDPALAQAVVALLHHYTASTGLQPLQQHAGSKGLKALLLLLCFHTQATQDSSAAASQLLALACGRTLPATPPAAARSRGADRQQALEAISGLPAAVPLTDAFHITVPLVQLASTSTRLHPAWCVPSPTSPTSRNDHGSSEPQQLLSQQEQVAALSAAAGQCLVGAFGPAQGSSAQDCPLSAAMVLLAHQLFQGPASPGSTAAAAAVASGRSTSRAEGLAHVEEPRLTLTKAQQVKNHSNCWCGIPAVPVACPAVSNDWGLPVPPRCCSTTCQQQEELHLSPKQAAACAPHQHNRPSFCCTCVLPMAVPQAAHREWLDKPPVAALAQLAAAYPHPQLLMRAVLALVLPAAAASTPSGVPHAPAVVPAPAAVSAVAGRGTGALEGARPPEAAAATPGAARRGGEAAKELAAFAQVGGPVVYKLACLAGHRVPSCRRWIGPGKSYCAVPPRS
jgi:hypothetical protein